MANERAINIWLYTTEDYDVVPKSQETGVPTGSYIYVVAFGSMKVLNYEYDPA